MFVVLFLGELILNFPTGAFRIRAFVGRLVELGSRPAGYVGREPGLINTIGLYENESNLPPHGGEILACTGCKDWRGNGPRTRFPSFQNSTEVIYERE